MKVAAVISLCITLLSLSVVVTAAENIPTITVYTEPPELEVWADGEYLGVGDAVLFGPFGGYVEVTVKGEGYVETTEIVDPPTEEGENVVVVIASEKKRWFSMGSFGVGFGIGLVAVSSILLFGLIAD